MKGKGNLVGHLNCGISIIIGATAFISTKVLLGYFTPIQVAFLRFLIGYAVFWAVKPKLLKFDTWKEEGICALSGVIGVTFYFLMQNFALTSTSASNVSVLMAVAPLFTVLIVFLLDHNEKPDAWYLIGMIVSLIGVVLVVTKGKMDFSGSMKGNLLSLLAAMAWAVYTVLLQKLSKYPVILVSRRVFFYGTIANLIVLLISGDKFQSFSHYGAKVWLGVLYLGIFCSFVAYATWNAGLRYLGEVTTNLYLYIYPIVTCVMSMIVIGERLTLVEIIGSLVIIGGLLITNYLGCIGKKRSEQI